MGLGKRIVSGLEKLPLISLYARTRGWHFVIAWCHRITGVFLLILLWLQLYVFTFPHPLGPIEQGTQDRGSHLLAFSQWVLAIPIIFHALNGGRLILYESFGKRKDDGMLRWMFGLCGIYLALLGLVIWMGNQRVSPFFFWLTMVLTALILAYGFLMRIWKRGHSFFWMFQRISGVFLLVMVPAYLLFNQLQSPPWPPVNLAFEGMQKNSIKAVYLVMLLGALYHGGYGLWAVGTDYGPSKVFRKGLALVVTMIMLFSAWAGIRLVLGL